MSYSLATLWYERQRYLPGILAVAFSALLIALQCGLLMGLFSITSIPIDNTRADIWLGAPEALSVDLGRPIREGYLARLAVAFSALLIALQCGLLMGLFSLTSI